jgi:CheY-like chemotaxis protein
MGEASQLPLRGIHVLVADDDDDARRMLGAHLRRRGASVVTAENGRQALALVNRMQVDVIVSAVSMPGVTGADLIRHVRATYGQSERPLPAIATAACADAAIRREAGEAGFDVFMPRPVDLEKLAAEVERLHRDSLFGSDAR